jgi:hypothetical protein
MAGGPFEPGFGLSGGGLAYLCTTTTEAAPPFVAFEGWALPSSSAQVSPVKNQALSPIRNDISLRRSVVGRLAGLPCSQRCLPTFESRPDLILGHSLIICGRGNWQGVLHLDQDDSMYPRIAAVEVKEFLEQGSLAENLGRAFEAISFAQNGIDDIYLDRRIAAQVGYGARRANVGEDEVIISPHGSRSLGREVRSPVRAHGRDEAEALLADNALHVVGQDSHGPTFSDCVVGTILI